MTKLTSSLYLRSSLLACVATTAGGVLQARYGAAILCLLLFLSRESLLGQGVSGVSVMHTGAGPLSSQSLSFTGATGPQGTSLLNLNFGFATDEQPQPGVIADSFTISITGPDGTVYLVTMDATGEHWAPSTPGALPLATGSLQWEATPFLAPTEGLTNLASYALAYTLPANWQSISLTVNFDLFDNQNALPSLAYYGLAVPEPSAAALLILSLVLWKRRG